MLSWDLEQSLERNCASCYCDLHLWQLCEACHTCKASTVHSYVHFVISHMCSLPPALWASSGQIKQYPIALFKKLQTGSVQTRLSYQIEISMLPARPAFATLPSLQCWTARLCLFELLCDLSLYIQTILADLGFGYNLIVELDCMPPAEATSAPAPGGQMQMLNHAFPQFANCASDGLVCEYTGLSILLVYALQW